MSDASPAAFEGRSHQRHPTPSLPSDPMEVHASRALYFERLQADPYGFENPAYDWEQDTRFALWVASSTGSCWP